MEATQAQLLSLLDGKKQFIIPIYQRTYSWQLKQCEKLLEDILRVGEDETQLSHFIGSVVYFKPNDAPVTAVPQLLVIDGQQRLTTICLLLLALIDFLKNNSDVALEDETWEELQETYLLNKHRKDESKYKLLLTRRDKETFTNIINNTEQSEGSTRILENYQFFKGQITRDNIQVLNQGIRKLQIVDVILEKDKDNPQLIFESLNSTGLDLSQADLIRNYILMGQTSDIQTELYEKYWHVMEKSFGERIDFLRWFIRDYLTVKTGYIPNVDLVYDSYKDFLRQSNAPASIKEAVQDLFKFSKYYVRMVLHKEEDEGLLKKFKEISKLRIDVSYPFLLAIYRDYDEGLITKEDFLEVLEMVIVYVFRRAICGIPTNSLNKTFSNLYSKIKGEYYLESLKASFILMDSYRKYPTDVEFTTGLVSRDIYSLRSRNYLLESLENFKRKEPVQVENYTIEHILPQNENLSEEWKKELGDNWENVRDKYLHTLGNLTLTGYNSELSDRPFSDKKIIHGGFNSSPLFLNESVRGYNKWNEASILERAEALSKRACEIWKFPTLSEERLAIYREKDKEKEKVDYTLDNYEYLKGEMLGLYKIIEKRILNLDSSVKVEFKKLYIAFKTQTNFVDIVPQKSRLRLSLNIPFEKIIDPKGVCKDVTNLGRWGNGDVEVGLNSENEIDYAIELIEQALEEQMSVI